MTMVTRNSEGTKPNASSHKDASKSVVHLTEASGGVSGTAFGGMAASHLGEDTMHEPLVHSTNVPILPAGTVHRRDSVMSNGSNYTHAGLNDDDNEDSDDEAGREKRSGRRKIRIEYIEDKSRRHITFSKRKAGIMKKVTVPSSMWMTIDFRLTNFRLLLALKCYYWWHQRRVMSTPLPLPSSSH